MSNSNSSAKKLIFLCWLAYSCSYIGKLSYSANILPISEAFGVSNAECGIVASVFFFVYGAGQIFNGIFCKKYNVKYVIFSALTVASIMNLLVAIVPSFSLIKYIWLVNGAAMSFLWTSLIRLISETVPSSQMPTATVTMGTTVATGTFIVYAMSAIYTAAVDYRATFITAAALMMAVAVFWLASYNGIVTPLLIERSMEISDPAVSKKSGFTVSGYLPVFLGVVFVFCISNNFIKDGLTSWTPKILSNLYSTPDWLSILLTLLLAGLAIFGAFFAVRIQRATKNFALSCAILFSVGLALIIAVILLMGTSLIPVTIACFAITSCLMAGVNNIVTSMIPLALKDRMNSGRIAGIINGFCYLGSTASTYGLGLIADNYTWLSVFYVLAGACALAASAGFIYALISKVIKQKANSKIG